MSALESIIEWAETLPDWESDTIRRLLTQADFNETDQQEIITFIKKEHGLIEDGEEIPVLKKLQKGDVSGSSDPGISIALKSVECVSGINAIPNNSALPFSPDGLNVVYGDNGSGKSGYARVLKKACRARDTKEDILGNVFDGGVGQAKAILSIVLNGNDKPISWENGEDSEDELSNISVFDARCARAIIDSKNNAHYLPYGTPVFGRLGEVLQDIRTKLDQEKPSPEKPEIEGIDLDTKAGSLYDELSGKTKKEDLEKSTVWEESDEERLNKLNKEIINVENNDPLKQATKIRKTQERIKALARYLLATRTRLSGKVESQIEGQIASLSVAEKALAEASKLSLSGEPLEGVGSNVWQDLYNAAKEYSLRQAYSGKEFPNLEEDSLCVLCMQPIGSAEIKARFERFKKFMEDTTKQAVEKEKERLSRIRQLIEAIPFHENEAFNVALEEISERDEQLPEEIKSYIRLLEERKENVLRLIEEKRYAPLLALANCPKRKIYNVYNALEKEAKKLEGSADPDKLKEMKSAFKEDFSKRLLSKNKERLLEYVDQLVIADKYDKCVGAIDIRDITTTGKSIVSKALTPQLKSALEAELKQLGGSRFPVFFKVTGDRGSTEHQLHLEGATPGRRVSLSDILSEGEQSVIAIAGFLAELDTSNQKNPIVLDDPVCSLDHKFRRKIARRLALESKERQVVVFTHDLSFLVMLQEFSEKEGNEVSIKSIERTFSTPGIYTEHMPWDAMSVKERIKVLRNDCGALKDAHKEMLGSQYKLEAGMLYNTIRETWERLVEELLLNGVVYRFGRDIQTQRLSRVAGDITDDDYKKIDENMTKASRYLIGHDTAPELQEEPPDPEEILEDINAIETYRVELATQRKRQARK